MSSDEASSRRRGRRGNGEGSIYRRASDGLWCASLSPRIGKRQVLYGRTRSIVARKLALAIADQMRGLPPLNERITVKRYLEDWLSRVAKPRVRYYTFSSYEVAVRLHIVPVLGAIRLSQLTPQDVQELIDDRLEAGISAKTVRGIRQVLRTALGDALREGFIHRNVAALVRGPHAEKFEVVPLSLEELSRFLAVVREDLLESLYLTALALGLRLGEVLGLEWRDIDFSAGTVAIRQSLQYQAGVYVRVPPKTRSSRRVLPAPPTLMRSLERHWEEQQTKFDPDLPTDLVFTRSDGFPLDRSVVLGRFQDLLVQGGLRKIRFHDLRHSCSSFLLGTIGEAGSSDVPATAVMGWLGHSDLRTTVGTYVHPLPGGLIAASARMEALLSGSEPIR